jgi:fibrillarin-like rRNA methylase
MGGKVYGERISAHGHRYYEWRENRSDKEKYT